MNRILSISTIVLLIGFLYSIDLSASCEICPKRNICNVDLSNKTETDAKALHFIQKLWNSLTLTKKGEDLRDALLFMANSEVGYWRTAAAIASNWIVTLMPQIKCRPKFCGFTQIINSTMSPDGKVNCEDLKRGVEWLGQSLVDASQIAMATTLKNAGCCCEKPKITTAQCYGHGSIYPAYKFWKKYGYKYPCILQNAAMNLYHSRLYEDEFMGAVAAASIVPAMATYYNAFNHTLIFQVFNMLTICEIPQSCCDYLKADLAETMSFAKDANENSARQVLIAAGCLEDKCQTRHSRF